MLVLFKRLKDLPAKCLLTRSLEEGNVSISKESFGSGMNASVGDYIMIKGDSDTRKNVILVCGMYRREGLLS
jgi:hypothetical protein